VFGQAASFALLAAISPTALLVMAVYLGSAQPRRTAGLYLAGALLMSTVTAVVLLIVVRSIGLNLPTHRTPRYGVRLGLGVLALAVAAFAARRRAAPPVTSQATSPVAAPGQPSPGQPSPCQPSPGQPSPGQPLPAKKRNALMSRLMTEPSPAIAFLAGLLLFAPSLTFIAAVQAVASAGAGAAATVLALIVVVVISAAIVWLPLLTYLFYPEQTTRRLGAANGWLRAHGRQIVLVTLTVCGVLLVLDGALGLAG
jgi:hypothetical protein